MYALLLVKKVPHIFLYYLDAFSRFQNSSLRFFARSSVSDAVDARLDMADTDSTSSSRPPSLPPTLAGGLAWGRSGGEISTLRGIGRRGGVYDRASSPKPTLEAGLDGRKSFSSLGGALWPALLYVREWGGFIFLESDSDFSKLSFKRLVVTSRWCRRECFASRSSGVGDLPRSRTMSSSSPVVSVPEPARLSTDSLGDCEWTSAQASRRLGGDSLLVGDRCCPLRSLLLSSTGERERWDSERELSRSACSLFMSSRRSREKCVPRAWWAWP